jgi:Rieske Fe-S protein
MATGLKYFSLIRRRLLLALGSLGMGLPRPGTADDAADAALPPQPGDRLVLALGDDAGRVLTADTLEVDSKQVFAYPQDPGSGVVRNGSRLNQVLVVKLDPAMLSAETLARSAAGVVAYSGVCSHTGCDVDGWNADVRRFQCPCHESQFDPADAARVVGGPAPWQLAALPVKFVDGRLTVAEEFQGRVGFMQPGGLDPVGG